LPECEGKASRFGAPDRFLDTVRIVTARETGADGGGNGAGASVVVNTLLVQVTPGKNLTLLSSTVGQSMRSRAGMDEQRLREP